MCETTDVASMVLASAAVAFGFLLLLVAALPLPLIRQMVFGVSRFLLRFGLLMAVMTAAVWSFWPGTEPEVTRTTMKPLIEEIATMMDVESSVIRPFVYLNLAATVTVVGILVIGLISFAQSLGAQQRLLTKLFVDRPPQVLSPPQRPKRTLSQLLGRRR